MNAPAGRLLQTALTALCILAVPCPSAGADQDWTSWSGPHHDLTWNGRTIKETGVGLETLWSRALGSGYSSVLVVGEQLVTGYSDGESDLLVALDAGSGDEQWRYRIGDSYRGHDGSDDGPLATPTIHGGRVYGLGGHGRLFALRLDDGEEIWARSLVDDLGAREPFYGFSTAPTLVDGVLVIQTGGDDGHSISGLDPDTGKLLWSAGDDRVTHQSPAAVSIDGKVQVVAVTDHHLLGLAPRTGEVLWRHRHTEGNEAGFTNAQVLPMGNASFLITGRHDSRLLRVARVEATFRAVEVWRSRALYGSLTVPVPFEEHIYGFVAQKFLTCVDARTGETVWKSRQPGGGTLVLADGHLVILAPGGEVVLAEATPEGYRERARLLVMRRGYFTRPTVAGDSIYTRNLGGVARVRVTDRPMPGVPEASDDVRPEFQGRIAQLAQSLAAAPDRTRTIDDFLAAQDSFPILEHPDLVHFVFRGEVEDLRLTGNMQVGEEFPMRPLADTDLYVHSMRLEPGAWFQYVFTIFDEQRLDPRNPRQVALDGQELSVLTTQGWKAPAHLAMPAGPRGRFEPRPWNSKILGNEREVRVYLPPGYEDTDRPYPLAIVSGGEEALEFGLLDRSLDNLVGAGVAPMIVVFIPKVHWDERGSRAQEYADALVKELMPRLEKEYRIRKEPSARALLGVRWGGAQSLYIALRHPDLFGKVAAQSLETGGLRGNILELLGRGGCTVRAHLEWSTHGYGGVREFIEPLREVMTEAGCPPVIVDRPDGMGWGGWRQHNDALLQALFPMEQ